MSWADWGRFVLEPGGGPRGLLEPDGASLLDFVLASSANPGGFAPRLLDRDGDRAGYRARAIEGLPEHGRLWYPDGGLLQAEPIGRVLEAARAVDERDGRVDVDLDVQRIALVVDPRSEGPSGSGRWSDPDNPPTWSEGLSRALAVIPAQVIYDDLRRTEKRNTRLEWADALVEALAPHLDDEGEAALDDVLARIDRDRAELPVSRRSRGHSAAGGERTAGEAGSATERVRHKLHRAAAEVGGLVGKEPVAVDVISPLLVAEETGEDVPEILAGEFLSDFGGFLREELRESDFALGYECALTWLRRSLGEADFEDDPAAAVIEHVEERRPGDWREANRGRADLGDLPLRARFRLGRYGLHMLRVLATRAVGR